MALAVNLRLATDIIADDPASGMEMLDQMVEDVQTTIRELRELAHGIYPPLLAGGGLAEALRAAANRAAIPVTVTAEGVGRYSQDIETAMYFCCLEALQNVGKHAAGATAQVRLWEESGGLLFSVSDNGPGFDAARARGGHGFVNMSDRLGAIGGTVRWESRPGHGSHDQRFGADHLTIKIHRPQRKPSRPAALTADAGQLAAMDPELRSAHNRRSRSAPNCSLFT